MDSFITFIIDFICKYAQKHRSKPWPQQFSQLDPHTQTAIVKLIAKNLSIQTKDLHKIAIQQTLKYSDQSANDHIETNHFFEDGNQEPDQSKKTANSLVVTLISV